MHLRNQVSRLEEDHQSVLTQLRQQEESSRREQTLERQESAQALQTLRERLAQLEEKLRASERELLLRDSEYQKDKALLEHKVQHYETTLADYNKKERSFDTSLDSTRNDYNSQLRQLENDYLARVQGLTAQVEEHQERNQELVQRLEALSKQLADLTEEHASLQHQSQTQAQFHEEQVRNLGERLRAKELELQNALQNTTTSDEEETRVLRESLAQGQQVAAALTEENKALQSELRKQEALFQQ